ncbi:PBP1A family penicillin-binding protein [Muricomes intestini]|uniref:PBP1A family penicillin-binding protein n=1 Tax=Muricomes intestini TaxID=1796634 RepID=UPI002FDD59AA
MNYGKENLTKKKKDISSKKNMKKKRVGVRLFKAIIICLLLIIVIGAAGAGLFVKKIIDSTPKVTPADVRPSGATSFVYAEDGTMLDKFLQKGSNRIYKNYDEIPINLTHAFVSIEDERFYQHNGIDMQGILRAGVVGLTSGNFSEGASTLTQQLIKNNVFPNFTEEKTFYDRLERKLQEQYLAVDIEKQMSKEEIVEAYMNTINLGQNCLGVQTAAKRYFGKDVSELALSECAVLAGITQSPSDYDPVTHPDDNKKRQDKVLKNMLKQKYISQAEYDEAEADPVYDRIQATAQDTTTDTPNSYFIDELAQQIIRDLRERKNYTETQAYNALYSGGLNITATQDPAIQKICDEEAANPANYPATVRYGLEYALTITRADGTSENYSKEMLGEYIKSAWGKEFPLVFDSPDEANQAIAEYKSTLNIVEGDTVNENIDITPQPQISVVVMDQSTGQVKAIVGGRGEKKTSLSLNRATDSTRQPGSCFKIVSTYAPALDSGKYTLASTILDEPYAYANGKPVNNWDDKYIGNTSVRYAILHSMNICAVKTLTDIGLQTGYDSLLNFGFTSLVNFDDPNYPDFTDVAQATALGGITRGVYNLEMTAAYAAIANKGTYTEPILYTKVLDRDGNILLDNTSPATHQVIKDSTAALLTSAMEDVINQGTGTPAKLNNMPAAGKTGTTEKSTDLWLSAYTPYYTCSVWTGFDSNMPMEGWEYADQKWHEVLWKNIMDRVHADLPYKDFTMPTSVEQKTICTITGLLATSSCPTLTEYFAQGTAPTQSCPGHVIEKPAEKNTDDDSKEKPKDEQDTDTEKPDDSGDGTDTENPKPDEGGGTDTENPDEGGGTDPGNTGGNEGSGGTEPAP